MYVVWCGIMLHILIVIVGAIGQRGFRQRIGLSSVAVHAYLMHLLIARLAGICVLPTGSRGSTAVDGKPSERDGEMVVLTAPSKAGTPSAGLSSFSSDNMNACLAKMRSLALSFRCDTPGTADCVSDTRPRKRTWNTSKTIAHTYCHARPGECTLRAVQKLE
jgi:hypothetical protein